jgi:hypothetical protein
MWYESFIPKKTISNKKGAAMRLKKGKAAFVIFIFFRNIKLKKTKRKSITVATSLKIKVLAIAITNMLNTLLNVFSEIFIIQCKI